MNKKYITTATNIVKSLQDAGFEAVFAGGCVRDMICHTQYSDIDIATNALPADIAKIFPDSNFVGASFGVVIVNIDDFSFEIASYRSDSTTSTDGRHPDYVTLGVTMVDDSNRRDFTINAMYMDPINSNYIYDFHTGIHDLIDKKIKFVGNADDRINEDYLRMMRAVRFASRFGFEIDINTYKAICKNAHKLSNISAERIALEINKMFKQTPKDNRQYMFDILLKTGIMNVILPEVFNLIGVEQPREYHPEGDVYNHTVLACECLPEDAPEEVFWATLLHDIGKPAVQRFDSIANKYKFNGHAETSAIIAEQILNRFKLSNAFIKIVKEMVENHMKFIHVTDMKKSTMRRFFAKDHFDWHLMLHKADCDSSNRIITNYNYCVDKIKEFSTIDINTVDLPAPIVNGYDIIKLGFKQGPIFKDILSFAMDMQLEGVVDKDQIIRSIIDTFIDRGV